MLAFRLCFLIAWAMDMSIMSWTSSLSMPKGGRVIDLPYQYTADRESNPDSNCIVCVS